MQRLLLFLRSPKRGDDVRVLALLGRIEKSLDANLDGAACAVDQSAASLRAAFAPHCLAVVCASVLVHNEPASDTVSRCTPVLALESGNRALDTLVRIVGAALRLVERQQWSALPMEKR